MFNARTVHKAEEVVDKKPSRVVPRNVIALVGFDPRGRENDVDWFVGSLERLREVVVDDRVRDHTVEVLAQVVRNDIADVDYPEIRLEVIAVEHDVLGVEERYPVAAVLGNAIVRRFDIGAGNRWWARTVPPHPP